MMICGDLSLPTNMRNTLRSVLEFHLRYLAGLRTLQDPGLSGYDAVFFVKVTSCFCLQQEKETFWKVRNCLKSLKI